MVDPQELVARLAAARRDHCFPPGLRSRVQTFMRRSLAVLFPHFAEVEVAQPEHLHTELVEVAAELASLASDLKAKADVVDGFVAALTAVSQAAGEDANALFQGDPAAASADEVILTYPGFYATLSYRIAHVLHGLTLPIVPRLISELARERTGVDIHPGASIGGRFMIDHGSGVVIGETAVIGKGVRLYQGVTLGAVMVDKRNAGEKRHPTLGDHVVVYANATILGGDTVIGHDSIVAGNAFITKSVPPFSRINRAGEARQRVSNGDDSVDFSI